MPVDFEQNVGQTSSNVSYLARGSGMTVFFTNGGATFEMPSGSNGSTEQVFRLGFTGANPNAQVVPVDDLGSHSNYFISSTASYVDVPQYGELEVENLYQGIDLIWSSGGGKQLKFDFLVHPGADASAIQMNWQGLTGQSLDGRGNMVLQTAGGRIDATSPTSYVAASNATTNQLAANTPAAPNATYVTSSYLAHANGSFGLSVGNYPHTQSLLIDPTLAFSSYLGGSDDDYAYGVAVDGAGDSYITGETDSPDFPATTGISTSSGGEAVFVTKLNAAGTSVVYSTVLGPGAPTLGLGIAVDFADNVYVTGHTYMCRSEL